MIEEEQTIAAIVLDDLAEFLGENGIKYKIESCSIQIEDSAIFCYVYDHSIYIQSVSEHFMKITSLADPQYREKFLEIVKRDEIKKKLFVKMTEWIKSYIK